jgi:hypothetical protein
MSRTVVASAATWFEALTFSIGASRRTDRLATVRSTGNINTLRHPWWQLCPEVVMGHTFPCETKLSLQTKTPAFKEGIPIIAVRVLNLSCDSNCAELRVDNLL